MSKSKKNNLTQTKIDFSVTSCAKNDLVNKSTNKEVKVISLNSRVEIYRRILERSMK